MNKDQPRNFNNKHGGGGGLFRKDKEGQGELLEGQGELWSVERDSCARQRDCLPALYRYRVGRAAQVCPVLVLTVYFNSTRAEGRPGLKGKSEMRSGTQFHYTFSSEARPPYPVDDSQGGWYLLEANFSRPSLGRRDVPRLVRQARRR